MRTTKPRRFGRLQSILRRFETIRDHRRLRLLILAPIAVLAMAFIAGCANSPDKSVKGDPSGTSTGTLNDTVGATSGGPQSITDSSGKGTSNSLEKLKKKEPLAYAVADVVGQNRISLNLAWTLVTGFLVMFMQAGLALVEAGFTRLKNAAHTMMMNFMIYGLGMLGYFICGFAFQFGGGGAIARLGGTPPPTAAGLAGT